MKIEYTSSFIKKTKKLSEKEIKKLSERIEWFKKDPFDTRLKTHPLSGKLKGDHSFSLDYSKRVVFLWIDRETVVFIDVGSHDEVYK